MAKYFSAEEMACRCCGSLGDGIDVRLQNLLDAIRERVGAPVNVSCVYRCPEHNAEVGGVPGSQHTLGTAADIARPDYLTMGEFEWYVRQLPFDGVGVYHADAGDFIHVDVRDGGVSGGYNWEEGSASYDY